MFVDFVLNYRVAHEFQEQIWTAAELIAQSIHYSQACKMTGELGWRQRNGKGESLIVLWKES